MKQTWLNAENILYKTFYSNKVQGGKDFQQISPGWLPMLMLSIVLRHEERKGRGK